MTAAAGLDGPQRERGVAVARVRLVVARAVRVTTVVHSIAVTAVRRSAVGCAAIRRFAVGCAAIRRFAVGCAAIRRFAVGCAAITVYNGSIRISQ
jgi:hypothetical protein